MTINRTKDVCQMTDAEVIALISNLRTEIGQLRSENKRLRRELRQARSDVNKLFV